MPIKFSPSFKEFKKGSTPTIKHDYIKNKTQEELFDYINSSNGKPKVKQKCRNELVRRGVKIVKVPVTSE